MLKSPSMRLISCIGLLFCGHAAFAQDIVIDWAAKRVAESPTDISKGQTVTVSVKNVNDILYDYKINIELQARTSSDDFAQLSKLLTNYIKAGAPPPEQNPPTCSDYVNRAKHILAGIGVLISDLQNNLTPAARPGIAISLEDSLRGWHTAIVPQLPFLKTAVDQLTSGQCTDDGMASAFIVGEYQSFDRFRKKVEGNHIAQGQAIASTGDVAAVKISVTESLQGTQLAQYNKTLHFSSVLTVSAGVLFSELQNRSYVQRQVPATSGTGTMNVLGADGLSGPTPLLLGLLNYKIPVFDFDKVGFSISSGPAIRLGSKSGTTSFGYFAGISIHLWHRLFITPGIHVGEFADYPAGLTLNQSIPANFGQLTPVNRWSTRFAIGITHRTNDLGPLSGQSQNNPGGANTPSNGASGPVVTLNPATLTFASLKVNTISAAQTVTLTNSGNATLTITGITLTGSNGGDYSSTNNCGSSVKAGEKCAITITFKPTGAAMRVASVTIADNAVGNPHSISLSGTGEL